MGWAIGNKVTAFIKKYIKKNNLKIDFKFISIEHHSYIYKKKNKDDYIDKVVNLIKKTTDNY